MYSTCLFCNAPFEKNESLEAFPVGRRLAFDEAKGRLWVVCKKCERWSLSPLDERWEAIEQAERLFRDTRKRVSTDNIGLAKVAEGTTLIRIGAPQRPEFAAWRYDDQFGRRRQRNALIAGGGITAIGALVVGGMAAGIGVGAFSALIFNGAKMAIQGHPASIVARIRDSHGKMLKVRRRHLGKTSLSQAEDGSLAIRLQHMSFDGEVFGRTDDEFRQFHGAEARRITAILLPQVNRFGGGRDDIATAVKQLEHAGDAQRFVDSISRVAHVFTNTKREPTLWNRSREYIEMGLFGLQPAQRLALEMALHEDAERRALEGELAQLERAWRDAEEIAAIADNLTLPDSVNTALDKLKKR